MNEALARLLEATVERSAGHLADDPLSFPHRYADPADREVVAYIAAALAFGNVRAILASVDRALAPLGDHPALALASLTPAAARRRAAGFNHRWIFAADLAALYRALGHALREHGGLEPLFAAGASAADPDTRPGAKALVDALGAALTPRDLARRGTRFLLPDPAQGAAKRLHMFLRWMIRPECPDLGLWRSATPAQLLVPLDTHVARIARNLGLTARRTLGLPMALDITRALRRLDPEDPTRYDFALAHLGISGACPRRRDPQRCAACELVSACRL